MLFLIFFYLSVPFAVLSLCRRFEVLNKVGPVLICYILGALLGNCGILPSNALSVQNTLSEASVALALPLLLFSLDVKTWIKTAGKAILSLACAMTVIVAVAGAGSILIAGSEAESWKIAGLVIGVYTGGTPNMAAIKTALDVDPTTYIMLHTYDVFISFLYILLCITFAQKLVSKFLPAYKKTTREACTSDITLTEDINAYAQMLSPGTLKSLSAAVFLSGIIIGLSVLISSFVPKEASTAVTILLITSFGIAASFQKKIRQIPNTYQAGMFFILIFCLVVGSMADLTRLVNINPALFGYISLCIFGTFILHAALCRLFHIDTDTFIITSVAAVCSPPFVPVVAQALNNKEIILSGLTTGIIGYALGNYLGISFAYFIRYFTG